MQGEKETKTDITVDFINFLLHGKKIMSNEHKANGKPETASLSTF